MYHFLYVLYSVSANRYYIGISEDIAKRIQKHNGGSVRSTKAYCPWIVVHTEQFEDKTTARRRELHLKKNYQARKELFENIQQGPIV